MIKLNSLKSSTEAIQKAGMAWSVEQTEIIGTNFMEIKSHKLLFRSDNNQPLGVVGSNYQPVSNSSAFAFMDVLADITGLTYESAAMIKGGQKIVVQARLGHDPFEVRPGDVCEQFVTLINSHNGSTGLRAVYTPIRLLCQNQLSVALSKATSSINLRHTSNIESRMRDAFQIFNLAGDYFHVFKEKASYLANKIMDTHKVNLFLDTIMKDTGSTRNENQRNDIIRLFEQGKGNGKGSAWDIFNATTEFVDYERGSNPEKRLESALFGSGSHLKQNAWDAALAL